jgi:hypothetical protein
MIFNHPSDSNQSCHFSIFPPTPTRTQNIRTSEGHWLFIMRKQSPFFISDEIFLWCSKNSLWTQSNGAWTKVSSFNALMQKSYVFCPQVKLAHVQDEYGQIFCPTIFLSNISHIQWRKEEDDVGARIIDITYLVLML